MKVDIKYLVQQIYAKTDCSFDVLKKNLSIRWNGKITAVVHDVYLFLKIYIWTNIIIRC